MSNIDTPKPTAKRGPKPIGDHVMTAAERQRRRRAKHASADSLNILVQLSGGHRQFIERLASASSMSRTASLHLLLDMAIARVANAVSEAEVSAQQGTSEDAITQAMWNALVVVPNPGAVAKYKEVMGIK